MDDNPIHSYDPTGVRRNRRRMAWTALVAMLIVTYMVLFKVSPERLKVIGEVVTWFYFVMGSIVGAYLGFSTAFDFKNAKGTINPLAKNNKIDNPD